MIATASQEILVLKAPLLRVIIKSHPIHGVPVRVGALEFLTPVYELSVTAKSEITISVPDVYEERSFVQWEDGSTDPTRLITVNEEMELTAYYELKGLEKLLKYKWHILIGTVVILGALTSLSRSVR